MTLIFYASFFRYRGKYVGKASVTHRYFCSAKGRTWPNAPAGPSDCDGRLTIRVPINEGRISVDYYHHVIHAPPYRVDTKPGPEALAYIESNIEMGPSELYKNMCNRGIVGAFPSSFIPFNLVILIKSLEIGLMIQKQVYYYWAVHMKKLFLRDANQFVSAVKLLEEMSAFHVQYVEETAPRSISVCTSIGLQIMASRRIQEVYIDSTRTLLSP